MHVNISISLKVIILIVGVRFGASFFRNSLLWLKDFLLVSGISSFFYFLMLIGALFFWESHIWCEQIILYQRSINYFLCCFFRKNDLSPNIQKIVNKLLHLKIHFVTLHLILIDPGWLNESKNSQIFSQCSKKFFVLLRVKSCFTLTLAL